MKQPPLLESGAPARVCEAGFSSPDADPVIKGGVCTQTQRFLL